MCGGLREWQSRQSMLHVELDEKVDRLYRLKDRLQKGSGKTGSDRHQRQARGEEQCDPIL